MTSARGRRAASARARARMRTVGRRRLLLLLAGLLALAALAIAPLATNAARSASAPATPQLLPQSGKLTGAGEAAGGRLGSSAALSADGDTLIVGAPQDGRGAAYVYTREGSEWKPQGAKLTPGEVPGEGEGCSGTGCEECAEEGPTSGEVDECAFGGSVALSADGNIALVGDPSATSAPGAAWVFTREGSTWTRTAVLVGGDEGFEGRFNGRFGRGVALSADGATALIGDPSAENQRGAAWVFTREGSTWGSQPALLSDEEGKESSELAHVGRSVALSADGDTALLGGPGDGNYAGAAWVFTRSAGEWSQQQGKLVGEGVVPGNHFGKSVALSGDGGTALVGSQDAEGGRGAAWAFARGESRFVQQGAELKAYEEGAAGPETEGRFGASVALSSDGDTALIGAPQAEQGIGTVTVLKRAGATWSRLPEGLADVDATKKPWLGTAVALSSDGTTAAIGGSRDEARNGAAWVLHEEPPPALPPVVTNVAPGRGPTAGGTAVTITGEGFSGATQVRFGATAVLSFTVDTPERITTVTPAAPAATVDVVVTTPRGVSAISAQDRFRFEGEGGAEKEKEKTGSNEGGGQVPNGTTTSGGSKLASGGVLAFVATSGDCRVSLAKKRLAVTRYRTVALRLVRTGSGPCSGSIAISYRIKAKGRGYTLRTIGTARFSIPTATSKVITVRLSKAGQRWLRLHKGKGNASLAIARVVPTPTLAQSSSVRLSLKKARRAGAVKH